MCSVGGQIIVLCENVAEMKKSDFLMEFNMGIFMFLVPPPCYNFSFNLSVPVSTGTIEVFHVV